MKLRPCSALSWALLTASLALGTPARAELRAGDSCRASRDASFRVDDGVETSISAGDTIEVVKPGRTMTRVLVGDVEGRLPTVDLEQICAPARDLCTLSAPIKMTEARASKGKKRAFKIKAGAELEVLERGKKRARVRVGDLEGIVKRAELEARCKPEAPVGGAEDDASAKTDAKTDAKTGEKKLAFPVLPPVAPAPAGVKIAVLPLAADAQTDPVALRYIEEGLANAFVDSRTDTRAFLEQPGLADARARSLKDQLNLARRIGEAMGVDFVLTGRLVAEPEARGASAPGGARKAGAQGREADPALGANEDGFDAGGFPDEQTTETADTARTAGPDVFSLQLAAVDVKAAKVVKGVTLHPTLRPEDPWASASARLFEAALPPGGARPAPAEPSKPTEPGVARTPTEDWPDSTKPWFTNGLAYTTLGAAAVLAAGGAATGGWAWLDAEAYRAAPQGAPGRPDLASGAFTKGVVADGLYAAAVLLTAASGVLFVTGLDYESFEGR